MPAQSNIEKRRSHPGRVWPWLAAVASGVLLTLCFPPWDQGWLCWIALTPLICALFFSNNDGRRAALRKAALGYVTGLVFFTGSFYWLSTTLAALYENVWLYSLAPLVAMVLGGYFAFWGWFTGALLVRDEKARLFPSSRGNLAIAFSGACAWVAHEWVREWLFGGFGWNAAGVALHRDLPMIQIADITGVPGLSFLVVFSNLMAVIIVRRIAGEFGPVFLTRIRWEFSFTMAMIALVFSYGVRALLKKDAGATVPLRVVAVQPNIPQTEKFDHAMEGKVFDQLDRLTSLACLTRPAPQLVLWPEAATPRSMFADDVNFRFVIDEAAKTNCALLIGTLDFDPDRGEDYNVAVLLTERGEKQQIYRKIHLVPFGEYLPLRPLFSGFVGQLVPADFTPGREHTVMEMPSPRVRLAALICFEDTLGDLTRRFVANGADMLVNVTNDGWFGQSPAAEQHLANAAFRAVENRRPLIRCGNTGVTCSIDPGGRVDRWLRPFQQGFSVREIAVPAGVPMTFYTRHGDWFSRVAALVSVMIAASALWRARGARGSEKAVRAGE
jgi:apolipoprotein N-acyltransferase